MCDFSTAYYHDGTEVLHRGHVDDYYDGDCCCYKYWVPTLEGREWMPDSNLSLPGPGMYTVGHTGCFEFYYDGNKRYISDDDLPHGMYWQHRCCFDLIRGE